MCEKVFCFFLANEFVPEAPKFESSTNRVVWNQPTTADGLLDYQVSYSVYNSNEEPILAMNTTEVFTELTGKLLPSTWYTANVTAFYDTNSYFSSDILLFQTEGMFIAFDSLCVYSVYCTTERYLIIIK